MIRQATSIDSRDFWSSRTDPAMAHTWTEQIAPLERINAFIHGVGFVLSIPATFLLAYLAIASQRESMLVACIVYGMSLAAMYLFSTLSHAVKHPGRRHRMRAWDQGVIYLLIAGTFTPFIWSNMTGWQCIALLLLVWIAAGAGFYSKVLAKHRVDNMTSLTYILLGWVPALVLFGSTTRLCFAIMLLGGLLYTLGVLFLQNDHRAWYYHPLWHVMVLLASASHYAGIAMFAVLQWDR